jgi:hypothetical protein
MFAMAFKCFPCILQVFQMYVIIVSHGYRKSRSGVAHVAMDPPVAATYCNCWVTSGQRGPVARASLSGRRETEHRRGGPCEGA